MSRESQLLRLPVRAPCAHHPAHCHCTEQQQAAGVPQWQLGGAMLAASSLDGVLGRLQDSTVVLPPCCYDVWRWQGGRGRHATPACLDSGWTCPYGSCRLVPEGGCTMQPAGALEGRPRIHACACAGYGCAGYGWEVEAWQEGHQSPCTQGPRLRSAACPALLEALARTAAAGVPSLALS
jgi:hypothetical protein